MKTLSLEPPHAILKAGGPGKKRPILCLIFIVSLAFVLAIAAAPASFGQGITGSITGTVTDPSGASIAGATVTILQIGTNAVRAVTTSDAGSYTVTQLAPGRYNVKVDKDGFDSSQENNITLAIDQVAKIDVKLKVGSNQQTISVTAESPVIQAETSSVGLVVDSSSIQNTPLNGHLSILGLLNLVPGVQDVAAQDQVPVRGVTLAFGTNQRNSYGDAGFTFDGVTNMEVALQRGLGEVPALDALAEFKVITTGAPAEFNQPNQLVIVSQSGTNGFHGEALEFNRSRGTGAKPFYFGPSSAAPVRPPYQRNEYGGNLSGPILYSQALQREGPYFLFCELRRLSPHPVQSAHKYPAHSSRAQRRFQLLSCWRQLRHQCRRHGDRESVDRPALPRQQNQRAV